MPPECDRCVGKGNLCCSFLLLQLAAPQSGDVMRWVEMHPGVHIVEIEGFPFVRIDTPCEHLTGDGLCDIFGKPERPRLCREWPKHPEWQAPEGCEFRLDVVNKSLTQTPPSV